MSFQYALWTRKERKEDEEEGEGKKPKVCFPTKKCVQATVGRNKILCTRGYFPFLLCWLFHPCFQSSAAKQLVFSVYFYLSMHLLNKFSAFLVANFVFRFFFWFDFFAVSIQHRLRCHRWLSVYDASEFVRLKCTPYLLSCSLVHYSTAVKITAKKTINTVHSPSITLNALKLLLLSRKMFRTCAKSNFLQLHLSIWFDATMGKICATSEHRAEIKTLQWNWEIKRTIQKMEKFFNCPTLLVSLFSSCCHGSLFMCITFNDGIGLATVVRHTYKYTPVRRKTRIRE